MLCKKENNVYKIHLNYVCDLVSGLINEFMKYTLAMFGTYLT